MQKTGIQLAIFGMKAWLTGELMNFISADNYCITSKIIPLVRCIISKITSAVVEEPMAREVQKLVLQEMTKRMGSIEHVTPFAIANILDLRFKNAL